MGCGKKRGGGKPHEGHPSQKQVLDPPLRPSTFPTTLRHRCSVFSSCRNPRLSTPEALLEAQIIFLEGALSGVFSSPRTFCTPAYHGAAKNCLNDSRAFPSKDVFEASRTRKFTPNLGKIIVTQFLCGPFPLCVLLLALEL